MSKVWNTMLLILGTTFLLKLGGVPIGLDWLFSYIGLGATSWAKESSFWNDIFKLFTTAGAAGIVIGFFTKASFEWAVLAPFASATLITFAGAFLAIINYANNFDSWIAYLILTIYGIMGATFIFSLVEWVFNRSS